MNTPPTKWPTTMATIDQKRSRWKTVTPAAPVTTGSGAMLVPNHSVKRSRTFPWRSAGGT